MNDLHVLASLGALPHWSAFAIAAGVIIGFIAGVFTMALYALWLARHDTRRPDPAFLRRGEFVLELPAIGERKPYVAHVEARPHA